MRRSQTQHLSQLLKDFSRQGNVGHKLNEVEVVRHSHEILGVTLGRYVKKIYVVRQELILEVSSDMVRSELLMLREELRGRINEKIGHEMIKKVVLR